MGWRDRAACRGKGTEAFFLPKTSYEGKKAVTLCMLCPVVAECLLDALQHETTDFSRVGIRGGLGPSERAVLAKSVKTVRQMRD